MKYKIIYDNICNRAAIRGLTREQGYEIHHRVPKSLGGSNDSINLVKVTYREHFILHRILVRISEDMTTKFKMATALQWLVKHNKGKRIINSNQFAKARSTFIKTRKEFLAEIIGENGESRAQIYSRKGAKKRVRNDVVEWWHADHGYVTSNCYDLAVKFELNSTNLIKVMVENRMSCSGWRLLKNKDIDLDEKHRELMSAGAKRRKSNGNQFVDKHGNKRAHT